MLPKAGDIVKIKSEHLLRHVGAKKAVVLWVDNYQAAISAKGKVTYWGLKTFSQYFDIVESSLAKV